MKEYLVKQDDELFHFVIGKTADIERLYRKLLNEAMSDVYVSEYTQGFDYQNSDNMPSFSDKKEYYGILFDNDEMKFYVITNDYICSVFEQADEIKFVNEILK